MTEQQNNIDFKLKQFKKKQFRIKLFTGFALSLATILTSFLVLTSIEWVAQLNTIGRGFLLFLFVSITTFLLLKLIVLPLYRLYILNQDISDEEAASKIGKYFPLISDKLLNFIQLKQTNPEEGTLSSESIKQRSSGFFEYQFDKAVDTSKPKRPLKVLIPIAVLLLLLLVFVPNILVTSSERIINFNKEFIPESPFKFNVLEELQTFKNEPFTLSLNLSGKQIPDKVSLVSNNRRIELIKSSAGNFTHAFPSLNENFEFYFNAAGYNSIKHIIKVVDRPALYSMNIKKAFPSYLNLKDETVENTGNIEVPIGTKLNWTLSTSAVDQAYIIFGSDTIETRNERESTFTYSRQANKKEEYQILLFNKYGVQKNPISYNIKVVADEYPKININVLTDTILYSNTLIGGKISDDHGLRSLRLLYKKNSNSYKSINLPLKYNSLSSQNIFFDWQIDSLKLKEGNTVYFYLQVTDNDQYNGYKVSNTSEYTIKIPTKTELKLAIEQSSLKTEDELKSSNQKAIELKKSIDDLSDKLKSTKKLDWQDKKQLQDIIDKKEDIEKQIEELKKQNETLLKQQNKFQKQSEANNKKQEQLKSLIDELLDEETKQLYEELKKLLEENEGSEPIQQMLENIQNKEINLEQELERTLELFKKLKVDLKLEKTIEELNSLSKEQDSLANETLDKKNQMDSLIDSQENIEEKFNEIKEDYNEVKELNQDLKNPSTIEDTSGDEQDIEKGLDDSKNSLEENKRNKSSKSQKQNSKSMKDLADKMEKMSASGQMSQMQENLDDLKQIMHNLIKLSFNQEQTMNDFRKVVASDPRILSISQNQIKLKDDAKIVEDSLQALAKRVFAINSFVTRELNEMNTHMNTSAAAIRERKTSQASISQQLSMTSMNNLALLLNDVMQQMQQSISDASGKPKPGDKQQNIPGLSLLQKQLNKQIQELKQSGKQGKQFSQELAKLAAEQERIRKALQEMEEKNGEPGNNGKMNNTIKKMEETELDLVNKRITQQTIRRQQQIVTRLLEAENAMREREQEDKRESKTANEYENMLPDAFSEYLKQKKKELDLLKTMPPKLYPYYKKEVNEYFKRINQAIE